MQAQYPTNRPVRVDYPPDVHAAAILFADRLAETDRRARAQVVRATAVLGIEAARALVEEARSIYNRGGELTRDGTRRRTLGGIFFRLVRDVCTDGEHTRIFGTRIFGWSRRPTTEQAA